MFHGTTKIRRVSTPVTFPTFSGLVLIGKAFRRTTCDGHLTGWRLQRFICLFYYGDWGRILVIWVPSRRPKLNKGEARKLKEWPIKNINRAQPGFANQIDRLFRVFALRLGSYKYSTPKTPLFSVLFLSIPVKTRPLESSPRTLSNCSLK